MHDFRRLEVWERAHSLTLSVYRVTRSFPPEERFGLGKQMRRAAVSIESNIAEGSGRSSNADFSRFLSMANGSAAELLAQSLVAADLRLVSEETGQAWETELGDVQRMLKGLRRHLSGSV